MDLVDDLLRHVIALRVHLMLRGVVFLHDAEGVDAHLELDGRTAHALGTASLDEGGREVQARGGGGGGVLLLHGIDRLVLLGVALVLRDIGGQRHMARLVHGLVEREALGRDEAHEAQAPLGQDLAHMCGQDHGGRHGGEQAALAELHHGAGLQALTGLDETLPHAARGIEVLAAVREEHLARAAGHGLVADEAGGKHARLVGDEQVARVEEVHDVGEHVVLDGARLAVEHEQAAGVARLRRVLGDELAGKVVIEIVSAHTKQLPYR